MFPAYSVEAQAPEVQGKCWNMWAKTSAHQKHELRQRLQSSTRPVWSTAVRCCLVQLIVTPD